MLPSDADNMLHIFQLIVFGFLALVIVIVVLPVIGAALSSLFSGLRSSYDASLRRPAPKTVMRTWAKRQNRNANGIGRLLRGLKRESERQRMAKRDWEARKIELMRDHPPSPRR
jgi:hypothetical protein